MERARRLRKGAEFDTVYQKGTVVSGPLLVLRVFPNEDGPTRWGFAVGKRISKRSVVRNRIRRRLREAARLLPVADGYDVVVTARQRALDASFQDLQSALERAVKRAGILEDPPPC